MADQIVSVIAAGGGDYTSVQAAIDDADFTGIDRYIVEIRDTATYLENVVIGGSAAGPPSSTNHVVLRVRDAEHHAGVVGDGPIIRGNTGGHSITISEDWAHLHKLSVLIDTTAAISSECVRLSTNASDNSLIEACILDADSRNEGATNQVDCVYTSGDAVDQTHTFYNSVFIDAGRGGIQDFSGDATNNIEFCTVFDCGVVSGSFGAGIFLGRGEASGSTNNIYNTASVNEDANADGDFDQDGSAQWVGSNNVSGDGSAPGTSPSINEAAVDLFTDPSTYDLNVKDVDSALYIAGVDRSGSLPDARVNPAVDIADTARPTVPSIGAYEYIQGGTRLVTTAQAAFLATQASTSKAIVKATTAPSAFLATQVSTAVVKNEVATAQAAFLATQVAAMTTGLSTRLVVSAQGAFLAQQSASVKTVVKVTTAQSAFLATMSAQMGPIPPARLVVTAQAAFLATQVATATVADATPVAIETVFAGERIDPAVFFDLDLAAGAVSVWTGSSEIEIDGTVYLPLDAFDANLTISEGIEVEDLAVDLRLAGSQAEFLAIALNEPTQGRMASVWLGALRSDGRRLISRQKIFSGIIRNMPVRQGPDGQQIIIEVESELVFRNKGAVLRYATADQALIDPTDTFFDSLPGLESQEIRFGR